MNFTHDELECIRTALYIYEEACQMGRIGLNNPCFIEEGDYRYWKDIAPVYEAVEQLLEKGERWDTGLRERLGA